MANFRFWIPADKIEKSVDKNTGKRVMKIGGMASTSRTDTDKESLNPTPDGFDIQYLKEKGIVNWNHSKLPEAVIGEPTLVKFTKKGLYVESELYNESELANKVYDLAEVLKKSSKTRRLGYSIEGKVLERDETDEKKVTKAMITNIALTISPKNPDSIVDIIKGEFKEYCDEDLAKSVSDITDEIANGGKITYIVDITRKDGARVTVDDNYNIKVEKAMSTESAAPLIRSHVDGQLKDQIKLTKAEVFEKIFESNSVISFETANEIFEKLNKLTMSTKKSEITEDILNKAMGTLGLKSDENIEKSISSEEDVEDKNNKAALELKKGEDDDDDDDDDDDEEVEKEKKPVEKIKKSVKPDIAPTAIPDNEVKELIKSLGVIAKGTYDLQKANLEKLNEISTQLQKSNDAIEELGNSAPTHKSITTAKPVARTFQKGIEDELTGNNGGSQATQLSVSRNKTKIVNLLDDMTFEKGFNNELATAMTLFESSGQLNETAVSAMKSKGYELIN